MTKKITILKTLFIQLGLLSILQADSPAIYEGAIVRGDTTKKQIALVFTGHEYTDGGLHIYQVLKHHQIRGAFFFTGKFYTENSQLVELLHSSGHYLGPHSFDHLLYCSWKNRDSLLVTKEEFVHDLNKNYAVMESFGIKNADIFLPPFEWYNLQIADWCRELKLTLINMTSGTLSHTDYTYPSMERYWSSDTIYNSVLEYERKNPAGLNGFILLIHIGANPERKDKFYFRLDSLITDLQKKGYKFIDIKSMVK
ncbi:MAG: polysaccharide deacetylase family protein [Candidatus Marinimicrobia bacterium]|nr:polysaccharide deacetylase family protein [Candidatus Neomarinimicrobiota bacterium]